MSQSVVRSMPSLWRQLSCARTILYIKATFLLFLVDQSIILAELRIRLLSTRQCTVLILVESLHSDRNYKESRDAGDILLMVVLLKSCLMNGKFFPISERK